MARRVGVMRPVVNEPPSFNVIHGGLSMDGERRRSRIRDIFPRARPVGDRWQMADDETVTRGESLARALFPSYMANNTAIEKKGRKLVERERFVSRL